MTHPSTVPRFRPIEALRALRAVLRDPDDTAAVFRLVSALSGRNAGALRRRFELSRAGAELIEARPALLQWLLDRDRLAQLPDTSLGRAYLRFMGNDGLTADGLVEASAAADWSAHEMDTWIGDRLRDSHDLWHVVTGYGGDVLGEAALLAFTFAQTRSPGIGLLVAAALVRAGDPDARRLIVDGWVRGIRAAWFPAARWELLLAMDLDEVRRRLRVGPPPHYEPVRSAELNEGRLRPSRAA
jgi:ubiquinone biosynthesis protein COQ4